jgi:hypothetical protein
MERIRMKNTPTLVSVEHLHEAHPRIRAEDWRSPLIGRLLLSSKYSDGSRTVTESYRSQDGTTTEGAISLNWSNLREDFERCLNTYQDPVITEFASLALACILISYRPKLQITEVTRRGEKVDYWLGDRELLLEVSGAQQCNIDTLCNEKAENQLLQNPFQKSGYVCVTDFSTKATRLWFYTVPHR